MLDTVAIRMADGSLRPVINTSVQNYRRIILSPEIDNQDEVVIELHRGVGQGMFDNQLLDTIRLEHIPPRARDDLDVVLNLTATDLRELDVRVTISGTNISYGCTYNLSEKVNTVDVEQYVMPEKNADLSSPGPEASEASSPIDEDFVLGIDPCISYKREDIRREEWKQTKKKIRKGMRISGFVACVVLALGGFLLLSFFVYQGIVLPPLPPLVV